MIELEWFMVFGIFVAGMVVMFGIHEIGRYIAGSKDKDNET